MHATHERASNATIEPVEDIVPRARALMHMSCTCAQYATAHISAISSLSQNDVRSALPLTQVCHSGQPFASLRGALPAPEGSGSHAKP
jgi:hypothetical protein